MINRRSTPSGVPTGSHVLCVIPGLKRKTFLFSLELKKQQQQQASSAGMQTTAAHRFQLKHKKLAHVRRHTRMHARRHDSVETDDAHPVNKFNLTCMMGNLLVPARVFLMFRPFFFFFAYWLCLTLQSCVISHPCSFWFFKDLFNLNVVWTQNSHEGILFYWGLFVICFLSSSLFKWGWSGDWMQPGCDLLPIKRLFLCHKRNVSFLYFCLTNFIFVTRNAC